ncbi:hypothetical protein, partial [Shewanella sp.]|uniref:hypothetical protein n=1 Tax=Shewanella sp. TaxID=50422 RepID=UPI002580AF48
NLITGLIRAHLIKECINQRNYCVKKSLLIALTALPLFAYAGPFDSIVKSATQSVTDTVNDTATNALDCATNEAIKNTFGIKEGSTKQTITEKLGAPASTYNEADLEVWAYDLSALNAASPMLAETTKTLLKDNEVAQKNVTISFKGESVNAVKLADKAKS